MPKTYNTLMTLVVLLGLTIALGLTIGPRRPGVVKDVFIEDFKAPRP